MRSQRGSRVTSVSASRQGRRWPSALCLLAISVSILVAALLLGVAPPPAQAVDTGSITGTVTNTSNVGLGGIWVAAYRSNGSGGWDQVNQTPTAASGSYNLGGLPTGSYRIEFEDDSGAYVTQYYNNKPTKDLGNDVAVTAGATTADINATLVTLAGPAILALANIVAAIVFANTARRRTPVVTMVTWPCARWHPNAAGSRFCIECGGEIVPPPPAHYRMYMQ